MTAQSAVIAEGQSEVQRAVSQKLQEAVALPDKNIELHLGMCQREQRERLRQPAVRKVLRNAKANFPVQPGTTDCQNGLVIEFQHPSRKAKQLFARLR